MSFGSAFGTYIKELRIDTRAVFVVDRDGKVTYVEYLKEVGQHPDYDQAVEAVKNTVAG
jgi:thiol peroxidase